MGGLGSKLSTIVDDLKHSWYFRIWAFIWAFFAIVGFAALIVLGQRATADQRHPTWRTSIQSEKSINFPSLYVKVNLDELNNQIVALYCAVGTPNNPKVFVPIDICPGGIEPSLCRSILAGDFAATANETSLDCTVNITAPKGADTTLLFQFVEPASYGYSNIAINPTSNAWVYIRKVVVQPKGSPESIIWEHHLNYVSDVQPNDFFNVKFVMENFAVTYFTEDKGYDSWLSVGGIGGFVYFLVILHTIIMTLVSICIAPESKFLYGEKASAAYSNL